MDPVTPEPLARCPRDGLPLLLVLAVPRSFMEAIRAEQDNSWGWVAIRCPLCDPPDQAAPYPSAG